MPYLNEKKGYFYICKYINGKHKYLKKLPKAITKKEAQKLLNEWLPRYEKQRRLIDNKITNLRKFKKRHGIPYTVWDFKERGEGGDKNFHGNTSPKVVRQLLLMLTKPLDHVIDPMVGSGTTIDVCKRLGRRCDAFDLYPKREDIVEYDATQPWPFDMGDLIFIHPPYWNLVIYSNKQNDLSDTATVRDYYRLLRQCFRNAYDALKENGYLAVQQGDLVQDGRSYPLCSETYSILKDLGFRYHADIIKIAHTSREKSGMVAEYFWQKLWKISHDHILIFKK